MARKATISIEKLTGLGAEQLAQLVLDEAEQNSAFRKLVSAALASREGPGAVAKLIDRRLGALERARSFIEWNKVYAFRDDLDATVSSISSQLGKLSTTMAIDRLLRFIASHEKVFERVDDSSGAVQDVYYRAITALGELVPSLREEELALLPNRIMAGLGQSSHGYLVNVAEEVMEPLPDDVLRIWDAELKVMETAQEAEDAKSKDRFVFSNIHQYRALRQLIADRLGDLDGLIALEELKHPNSQDTMAVAERLLEAGRLPEALDWVRRKKTGGLKVMGYADLADGLVPRAADSPHRVSLEARILEALDDKKAAQKLRWSVFETSLDSAILREYLAALPDFEEFDALDRAFDHGLMSQQIYTALAFFMEWPELSFAAKLVIAHRGEWDGSQYYMLPTAADALQHEYALAATILYRALLDDILSRARSKAYKHGAHYLDRLDSLADQADREATDLKEFQPHANYRANLQTKHARKSSFWAQVK